MLWIYISIGGLLGALARHGVVSFWSQRWDKPFPIAVWQINIIGSFLLGVLVAFPLSATYSWHEIRVFLGVGFLGAFTTFSTYSYQIMELLEEGNLMTAFLYTFSSVLLGLTAAWLGRELGIFIGN